MKKVFWRSKEKENAPADAKFFVHSFRGNTTSYSPELLHLLPSPCKPIPSSSRIDNPTRSEWMALVEKALKQIEKGHLRKVVLARKTILHLSYAPDPFEVLAALEKKEPNAALFCLQFNDKTAFLGASPERLFQRKKKGILVDAIAGTRKLAPGMKEELLASEKDRREFQFVQDYLDETLRPFCHDPLSFSKISVHKTANIQHLYTQGKGVLIDGAPDKMLLDLLHPTPAVCGTPKRDAFDWIHDQEPFDRNLYSGVIGWSTDEQSDWTVAIRSCFLDDRTAFLYTGTGIVAGSDPEKEWDELEAKLALYEEIFPCGH
jgi:menaquinone-specific isochorismate synthase